MLTYNPPFLQKALKDKNIRDIANAYGWDENTLRKVDA